MRKGILGLLAYCLAGLEIAHGQTGPGGGYQEPLPIPPPGVRYGAPLYMVPPPSRFPSYGPPIYPNFPSQAMPQSGGVVQASAQEPVRPMPTFDNRQGLPVRPPSPDEIEIPAPLGPIQETTEDNQPASPKETSGESKGGDDLAGVGAFGHAEPAEPYMVGPVGNWKPTKGYSFYGTAEYLLWWVKAQTLPANLPLSLSSPNTVPELTSQVHSGDRFFVGIWLSDQQDLSAEAGYFSLLPRTADNSQNFGPSPITMLPTFAGIDKESVLVSSSTSFWGAEANLRYQIWRSNRDSFGQDRPSTDSSALTSHLDVLGGFRFVDLSEALTLRNSTLFSTAPVALSNALLTTSDTFGTHNHVFAGQIGADAGVRWDCFSANVYTKIGFGGNEETVNINGITQVSGPPVLGNQTLPGGFFAQASNSGRHTRDAFTVLPEVGVNLAYKVSDHCRLGVGYTFVYMSNVVRPGDQIDATAGGATRPPTVFLGGPVPQPAFSGFNSSSFWAQGVNFTVELSY
jgi:hypothetical protein